VIGVVIAVVLGLDLLSNAYAAIGNAVIPGVDERWRTIIAGALTGAIVLAVVSLLAAFRVGGAGAIGVIILGLVLGAALGAFTAITFAWRPAFGVGLTVAYATWLALMVADLFSTGVDDEALKARFYPSQTIDTTKETLEWLKQRMPRANES
jgi:MFS family permease